jgi:capsular polysaccharide biosynthesis protein/Mrp family chromosome partitioning ATPase
MSRQGAPTTFQLSDYFLLLRRQWGVVVAGVLVGAVLAAGYLSVAPREYTSATAVLVTASTGRTTGDDRAAEINLDTEAQLVFSTETVAAAAELLGEPVEDTSALSDRLTVTVPPNTEILTISFVGPTAEQAQAGARAFARAYLEGRRTTAEAALNTEYDALQARIDEVREQLDQVAAASAKAPANSADRARLDAQTTALNSQLAGLGSQQNKIRSSAVSPGRVVTQAGLPTSPSNPDVVLTMLGGMVIGLLGGLALAALRHRRDDRILTAGDLQQRTDMPVAAVLGTPLHDGEITVVPPSSPDGRAYARLRNLVTSTLEHSPRKVVLVAATHRGGGSVAANVAASLARAGEDVVLVCADVYGSTATALLGTAPGVGLADVLAGERPAADAVRRVAALPTLRVLAPGSEPDRADALLETKGTRAVVDRLLESAGFVVVEAPPTTEGTGAQTLAGTAELAVVVVETGRTTARDVQDGLGQFESMHRPVLGAVVASFARQDRPAKPQRRTAPPAPVARVATGTRPRVGDAALR